MKPRTLVLSGLVVLALAGAATAAWLWFLPEGSSMADEELPPGFESATLVARGTFQRHDFAHDASGSVRLLSGPNGTILRFENYSATDGPDVYVYLTEAERPASADDVEGRGLRLLVPGGEDGGHATVRGDFNVPVPGGVDLSKYRAVAIWCDRFNALFGYASLTAA